MTTTSATSEALYESYLADRNRTAHSLYEAELAVHDARQSHVDTWLQAANDHLHAAVMAYLEAEARLQELSRGA